MTPSIVSVLSKSALFRCRGTMACSHKPYPIMVNIDGLRSPSVSQKSFQVLSDFSRELLIFWQIRTRSSSSIGFSSRGHAPEEINQRFGGIASLCLHTCSACCVKSRSLAHSQLVKPVDLELASDSKRKTPP